MLMVASVLRKDHGALLFKKRNEIFGNERRFYYLVHGIKVVIGVWTMILLLKHIKKVFIN